MLLLFIFLSLIHNSNAMQTSRLEESKIVADLPMTTIPLAIASTVQGNLIILDQQKSTIYDYKNNQIVGETAVKLDPRKKLDNKIYVHPTKDIALIPSYRKCDCFLIEQRTISGEFKKSSTNLVFSEFQECSYAFHKNCLRSLAFKDDSMMFGFDISGPNLKISGSPGLLFKFCEKSGCALFSKIRNTSMYEVGHNRPQTKLFDFCTTLDFTHWVYDSRSDRLYTITDKNRELYIADTKTLEQKVLAIPDNFKIGTLEFFVDKRILVLLSQCRDKICYFDVKNLKPLLITSHKTKEIDKEIPESGQKIAVFPYAEDIVIALSSSCLVVKIPPHVSWFNAYKKYCMLEQTNILFKELRHFIGVFLLMLDKKQRMCQMR